MERENIKRIKDFPKQYMWLVDKSNGGLTQGSHKKVDWKCDKCGYIWTAEVMSVIKNGTGCPRCAGHITTKGLDDLWTTNPDVAKLLVDRDLGYELKARSNKRVEWVCDKCGQTWIAPVSSVVDSSKGKSNGCPVCANKRIVRGINDLWTVCPAVAEMLVDSEIGYKVTAGSKEKVEYVDRHGNIKSARVKNLVIAWKKKNRDDVEVKKVGQQNQCNNGIKKGINDLWTTHPDIAITLFDRSQGYELSYASNKEVKWKCNKCGQTWDASVYSVVRGTKCPVCANRKIVKGINDLWTLRPDIADKLFDRSQGYELSVGSHQKVKWLCDDCGSVNEQIVTDVIRGNGCPVCNGKKAKKGVNDLWTTHPEIASKLVDKDLGYEITFGANRKVECKCDTCGNEWESFVYNLTTNGTDCPVCTHTHVSKAELELNEYIQSLDVKTEQHNRTILNGREVDIYVLEKKIAFEYNGLFWHSDEQLHDRHYHENKFIDCEKNGVQLITIWEDDWLNRQDVVKDMVKYKLGKSDGKRIYARKCNINLVDPKQASEFLKENHIQGKVASTYHFGLFYEDDLVALLSVRSPKQNARMKRKEGQWEIQRYATKGSVVGGFSRLMKYAEKYIDGIRSWISFSSNDVSNGRLYLACGFTLDAELPADYKYFGTYTNNVRSPKERFQKKKFKNKQGLLFEDGLTERKLAQLNELYRVYDCGKRRWIKDVMV